MCMHGCAMLAGCAHAKIGAARVGGCCQSGWEKEGEPPVAAFQRHLLSLFLFLRTAAYGVHCAHLFDPEISSFDYNSFSVPKPKCVTAFYEDERSYF
jgi:hypothetical protein